ncbi:hypothetical protein [Proteus mirabilis]|uniref:hypothetical protein n=1 Tax=Proteus mirabilis TaxID=584 RepID=UPI0023630C63|nr:hypothetical protein [Proteus mirabilis]MDC9750946.1 hypothetical protein [Proteus mirabilis]
MTYSPNEDRSNSLNPNNSAHDASIKNMYRQYGANVWFRIVHISDMTGEPPFCCDRITNTDELKAFFGGDFVAREDANCTHLDPGCLCVVDFEKTAKSKPGYRLDIGDKHDMHNFLLMKEPINHW